MDIRQTIINVINTLNQIPVSGKQSMDRLLGSIMALEKVVGEMDRREKEEKENDHD